MAQTSAPKPKSSILKKLALLPLQFIIVIVFLFVCGMIVKLGLDEANYERGSKYIAMMEVHSPNAVPSDKELLDRWKINPNIVEKAVHFDYGAYAPYNFLCIRGTNGTISIAEWESGGRSWATRKFYTPDTQHAPRLYELCDAALKK